MMHALQILEHPDARLKQTCTPVSEFDDYLRQLAADMLFTIGPDNPDNNRRRTGVGLAAPQVGQAIRMVVIAAPGFPEMALVNPVITRSKGWGVVDTEGCLSVPFTRGHVIRYSTVWVDYQDLDGNPQHLKSKDFLARVIQHEVDHLDGIEFTDRIQEQQL